MAEKIKVLYFMGEGRSGGTILAKLLNQADGVFSAGEVRKFWKVQLDDHHLCSCNQHPAQCEVWSAVYEKAFGAEDTTLIETMNNECQKYTRNYQFPRFLVESLRNSLKAKLPNYVNNTAKLYRSIQAVTGADIIIDSSRFLTYGGMLAHWFDDIDVYFVHLVRDPRAVAYSWNRKKHKESVMYSPSRTALRWNFWNIGTHLLAKEKSTNYLRLHYEELTQHPQQAVERILEFVEVPRSNLPFINPNEIKLASEHHILAGNNSRFGKQETLQIEHDAKWQTQFSPWKKLIVTLITFPLLVWYGYLPNRYDN